MISIFSEKDGLPTPYTRALTRSKDGALWVSLISDQADDPYWGIARIVMNRNEPVIRLYDEPSGLRPGQVNDLIVASDGRLWAATNSGLYYFDDNEQFVLTGSSRPMLALAVALDHSLWAWGGDQGEYWLARITGKVVAQSAPFAAYHQPFCLLPVSPDMVWFICRAGILYGSFDSLQSVELDETPLFVSPPAEAESDIPSVWLYAAALNQAGMLFLAGHSQQLVRVQAGHFESIASGAFADIVGDNSDTMFVSDFSGKLFRLQGEELQLLLDVEAEGEIGTTYLDRPGSLWIEIQRRNAPHQIVQMKPPYKHAKRWALETEDGFLSPGVFRMVEDGAGGIYVSTNRGIWHLH